MYPTTENLLAQTAEGSGWYPNPLTADMCFSRGTTMKQRRSFALAYDARFYLKAHKGSAAEVHRQVLGK